MKRIAVYRFCFEDGSEVVTANMTCYFARELIARHGKFTDKRFVAWMNEMTVGDVVDMDSFFGGEKQCSNE